LLHWPLPLLQFLQILQIRLLKISPSSINRLGYSQPTIGASFTLDSIAPVVLGGTSLLGGVGGIVSTLFGVLVAGVLNNLMVLLGVNIYAEQIVQGAIILLFVFFFIRFQRR
jgi:ribose transport system permease protein